MDLHFLHHLRLFWTVGRIYNHIAGKFIYFENEPGIILNIFRSPGGGGGGRVCQNCGVDLLSVMVLIFAWFVGLYRYYWHSIC